MRGFIFRLMHDRSAATAIEYGLIAALVCVGAMAALLGFGSSASAMYAFISDQANNSINDARANGGL
jgi:pilus assembly protein Flp/PilA